MEERGIERGRGALKRGQEGANGQGRGPREKERGIEGGKRV